MIFHKHLFIYSYSRCSFRNIIINFERNGFILKSHIDIEGGTVNYFNDFDTLLSNHMESYLGLIFENNFNDIVICHFDKNVYKSDFFINYEIISDCQKRKHNLILLIEKIINRLLPEEKNE